MSAIQDSPFTAQTTLSNKNEAVASIILDCALNYGIFGFGESVQVTKTFPYMYYMHPVLILLSGVGTLLS